jgi:hypothetical protein
MLGILGLAVLTFLIALVSLLVEQPTGATVSTLTSTALPVSVTTPTQTSTITLTPRPTWTLPPSPTHTITVTPTPTRTNTLVPSLTPAQPQARNSRYRLVTWNLVEADRMIALMNVSAQRADQPEWYQAVAFARQEALLRFPQALEAPAWRWQIARNQVQAGDSQAMEAYTELIQTALDAGQVRSSALPAWFQIYEPDMSLEISTLPARPGELGRSLIQISGSGSLYLFLLETPGHFQVIPLLDDLDDVHDPRSAWQLEDLTGDGTEDLIIYRTNSPGETQFPGLYIFDLSQNPPAFLPVQTGLPVELGMESERRIELQPNPPGASELALVARIFPACPVEIRQRYHWSDGVFHVDPLEYSILPDANLLAWCEVLVEHASLVWEPGVTLQITEDLLPAWPPQTTTDGRAYPADGLDAWRFRLGILQALTLHPERAIEYMQLILNAPSLPGSAWIEPARQFLDRYQRPDDLFIACQVAPGCNLRFALQALVRQGEYRDPSLALAAIQEFGVTTRASGYFDFDGDGINERWMSVQPLPGGKLEFWILINTPSGTQAIFVQVFENNAPQPYYHDPAEIPPVVQLERGRGFILMRDPLTSTAAIRFVDVEYSRPTVIRQALDQATQALFNGVDPDRVLIDLQAISASPRFAGDCIAFNLCARYYYTLGLVYELTGDSLNAIDSYLTVWRYYPLNPFTIMARLKLELLPATPTFTPTATTTLTPTVTTTLLPGQTVTHTPTPTETATNTITP